MDSEKRETVLKKLEIEMVLEKREIEVSMDATIAREFARQRTEEEAQKITWLRRALVVAGVMMVALAVISTRDNKLFDVVIDLAILWCYLRVDRGLVRKRMKLAMKSLEG